MRVAARDLARTGDLIRRLYTEPFDERLVHDVESVISRVTDSQYVSFCRFAPGFRSLPFQITTNPPEFIAVYMSVVDKDFLLDALISTGREFRVRSARYWDLPEHRDFVRRVQESRPIADILYVPMKRTGNLLGYCGMARAGLESADYAEEDVELFRFITGFVDDAFERSMLPPPLEDDTALLDRGGRIVDAGPRMRAVFEELFGPGMAGCGDSAQRSCFRVFLRQYNLFSQGRFRVGMDRTTLWNHRGRHTFLFQAIKPEGFRLRFDGIPCASARLLSSPIGVPNGAALDLNGAVRLHGLTPRECEVVRGVFAAKSNKAIARELGIDESTVKRHTHNIYEKTGLRSRVELVQRLLSHAPENQPKL